MFGFRICAEYVIIILVYHVRKKAVIEFTKHLRQGDPRINIQNDMRKAKPYQVRQVLLAIEKLEVSRGHKK